MSEFAKGFVRETESVELLKLPVIDFGAFRAVIYPQVTLEVFIRNLLDLLSRGRARSINGTTPNVLEDIFGAAGNVHSHSNLLNASEAHMGEMGAFYEFLEDSKSEDEVIARYVVDHNFHHVHGENHEKISSTLAGFSMYIYTKNDNFGRRYQLTWVPASSEIIEPALVIYFEQSQWKNLALAHPANANKDITKIIGVASTYRPEDWVSTANTEAFWAFYWNQQSEPLFVHANIDPVTGKLTESAVAELPFSRFPVLYAAGKQWSFDRFLRERAIDNLRLFAENHPDYFGKFESLEVTSAGQFVLTGADNEAVKDKLIANWFVRKAFIVPQITRFVLKCTETAYLFELYTDSPEPLEIISYNFQAQ